MPPTPPDDNQPQRPRTAVLDHAYRRGRRLRRRRAVMLAIPAVLVVAAVTGLVIANVGSSPSRPLQVLSSAPSATGQGQPPTTSPPDTAPTSPTTALLPVTTAQPATSTTVATTRTGTVRDQSGAPVAGAYVIGLKSLVEVTTDAAGRYSMPCGPEPMAASGWQIPVFGFGTHYVPQPSTPGLGYVFSGAAGAGLSTAGVEGCSGAPTDFVLPPGGNIDIAFLDSSGKAATNAGPAPIDNLYLPGMTDSNTFETEDLDASGHQFVDRLAAGTLRIDGVSSTLKCSGPGVTDDPSVAGALVTVVAGKTVSITCTES